MANLYLRISDRLARREQGQGLVEYALILVLVSIAAIATLGPLGTAIAGVFTTVRGSL
jgi:pilus assembly protein Flp/PilA